MLRQEFKDLCVNNNIYIEISKIDKPICLFIDGDVKSFNWDYEYTAYCNNEYLFSCYDYDFFKESIIKMFK